MGKLKRPNLLTFLKVPDADGGLGVFRLCGVYSDDLTISYNPVTEESQDVTEAAGRLDVMGYTVNMTVATKAVDKEGSKGYEVFNYVEGLMERQATGSELETEILVVKLYKPGKTEGSYFAQKWACVIQTDNIGGPAPESIGFEYTVNFNGEPTTGEAKLTTLENKDMTAEFTANV